MKKQFAVIVVLTLILFAGILGARHLRGRTAGTAAAVRPLAASPQTPGEAPPQDAGEDDSPIKTPKADKPPGTQKEAARTPAPGAKPENPPSLFEGLTFTMSNGEDGISIESEDLVKMASEQLNLSESQKVRVAAWAEWKAKAVEALPEAQREDAKKLKEIDTAYREGVKSELDQNQAEKLQKFMSRPVVEILSGLGGGSQGGK